MFASLYPQFNADLQASFVSLYGIMMSVTIALTWAQRKHFLLTEKWHGYTESNLSTERIQNPRTLPWILSLWLCASLCLTFTYALPAAALINWLICRYFFIAMRWKSLTRGFGAPGYFCYWLATAVLILEFTSTFAPASKPLALLVMQVDFALIFLSSGIYKFVAGYARNEGMEYGMVNPQWGFFYSYFSKLKTSNFLFQILNQSAWSMQILSAVLMLIPGCRWAGAALIFLSFAFVGTQIRLGLLCPMIMLCCMLFVSLGELNHGISPIIPDIFSQVISAALMVHLGLLIITHLGLAINLYARRRLPDTVQQFIDFYANLFGIIVWRVFTADLTNFFIRIYAVESDKRILLNDYSPRKYNRFKDVCESIALTSLFTTRKYHPKDWDMFAAKLLRYAATLPCKDSAVLEFEYVTINKIDAQFKFETESIYRINESRNQVIQEQLLKTENGNLLHEHSPIHSAARPGTYAPSRF